MHKIVFKTLLILCVVSGLVSCSNPKMDQITKDFVTSVRPGMTKTEVEAVHDAIFLKDAREIGGPDFVQTPRIYSKLHPVTQGNLEYNCFEISVCSPKNLFSKTAPEIENPGEKYLSQKFISTSFRMGKITHFVAVLYDIKTERVVGIIHRGVRVQWP